MAFRSAPKILMPMGVRTPVVSMSMRPLIGIVHAFVVPGKRIFESISVTSSSQVRRSHQTCLRGFCNNSGSQEEYQRSFLRHCSFGLRTTVVSIIEKGAGSVEDSMRPALPKTLSTSGKLLSTRSWASSRREASVTEMPGKVVGM